MIRLLPAFLQISITHRSSTISPSSAPSPPIPLPLPSLRSFRPPPLLSFAPTALPHPSAPPKALSGFSRPGKAQKRHRRRTRYHATAPLARDFSSPLVATRDDVGPPSLVESKPGFSAPPGSDNEGENILAELPSFFLLSRRRSCIATQSASPADCPAHSTPFHSSQSRNLGDTIEFSPLSASWRNELELSCAGDALGSRVSTWACGGPSRTKDQLSWFFPEAME